MTAATAQPKYARRYLARERGVVRVKSLRRAEPAEWGGFARRREVAAEEFGIATGAVMPTAAGEIAPMMKEVVGANVTDVLRGRQLAITAARTEGRRSGWDGYGALEVSREAVTGAMTFARLLPKNLPEPEIGPSPVGAVTFDWFVAPDRTLSVSVGPEKVITYAGILSGEVTQVVHGEIEQPLKAFRRYWKRH